MAEFKIGDPVIRVTNDHIVGRIGTVVQVGQFGNPNRIQVHWTSEADGYPIMWRGSKATNGLKTWMSPENLRKQ